MKGVVIAAVWISCVLVAFILLGRALTEPQVVAVYTAQGEGPILCRWVTGTPAYCDGAAWAVQERLALLGTDVVAVCQPAEAMVDVCPEFHSLIGGAP